MMPPSAAAWMIWARSLWWLEKPRNLALPDLRIASAVSLNSCDLTKLIASSRRVVVAQAVDEEEIDVVGRQGGEPLVEHPQHLLGRARVVLGDQDDLLANLGSPLEPLLESGLGAVHLGRVEGADAGCVRQPDQAFEDALLAQSPGSHLQHGDFEAGLAQLSLGQCLAALAGASCAPYPGVTLRAEAVASAPAWRNARRSERSVSSWAISLDSSSGVW